MIECALGKEGSSMSDEKFNQNILDELGKAVGELQRGKFAPIEDRFEYERQMEQLSPVEREIVQELTAFADLSRYFSERNQPLGADVEKAMVEVHKLPAERRAVRIREINQALMKRINDACQGTSIRQ
jgi:hypothetical protein